MKRMIGTLLLFGLTAGWVGCGSGDEGLKDDTAQLTPAGGTVTLDGEPLAYASVQFIPQSADQQGAYYGSTDMAGKFELQNARGRLGAEAGQFTVVISKFAQKDGTPLPPDADSGDVAALGMEHLPPNYSDPNKSEIRATIPPGGKSDFEFPLKSKK